MFHNILRNIYRLARQQRFYCSKQGAFGHYSNFTFSCFGFLGWRTRIDPKSFFADLKYAIYIDNPDPSNYLQVVKWFRYGFFDKAEVGVIVKFHSGSFKRYCQEFFEQKLNFCVVESVEQLSLQNIDIVFYPFNSASNMELLIDDSVLHVHINHGESDKQACIHPMMRVYDFLLVSGDIAIHRLLRADILRGESDIGRAIKVGLPSAGELLPLSGHSGVRAGLLYAPTWEGREGGEDYSSLLQENVAKNLLTIARNLTSNRLVVRPHPSTSIKKDIYLERVVEIARELSETKPVTLELVVGSHFCKEFIGKYNENKFENIEIVFSQDVDVACYELVVTDLSSVISNCIFWLVPHIVFLNHNEDMDMPSLEGAAMVVLREEVVEESPVIDELLHKKLVGLRKKLISIEEDFGSLKSNAELFRVVAKRIVEKA